MGGLLRMGIFSVTAAVCITIWTTRQDGIGLMIGFFGLLGAVFIAEMVPDKAQTYTPIAKTVVITNCDTGFGQTLALRLDQMGMSVFACCKEVSGEGAEELKHYASQELRVLQMDVTSDFQIEQAYKIVQENLPPTGLWAVVNCPDASLYGDLEWLSTSSITKLIDRVAFGTLRTTKAFLPLLRKDKGRVVNLSGYAGRLAVPGEGANAMALSAVAAMTDSLRIEMNKWGVKVVLVEPGAYKHDPEQDLEIEGHYKSLWESMDKDTKEAYGQEYLDKQIAHKKSVMKASQENHGPVIDVVTDALILVYPSARYIVSGGTGLVDWQKWMVLASPFIPTALLDRILRRRSAATKPR